MTSTQSRILTINGGSSSIELALFETRDLPQRFLSGAIERIGQPQAKLETRGPEPADRATRPVNAPNHAAAVELLMDEIQ
jgi:acetate kinase